MNTIRGVILFISFFLLEINVSGQFNAFSGGLAFSSGIDYNTGSTGNPGLFGKAYLKIDDRFHVVPTLTIYNRYKRSTFSEVIRNYMFQADLDGVVSLYKDKSLRFMGLAGVNATALLSKWEILYETPNSDLYANKSDFAPGLNLGGAFQLYVNDRIDGYISAKYVISSFDQLVINAGVIYYISGKRRRGMW